MSRKYVYRAQDFINAIPGSGGIISTIATRVGCTWVTVQRAIERYPTVKRAYDEEVETVGDVAEGVLIQNIKLAEELQEESGKRVDTSDIRWYLTKKLKHRGYGEAVEVTGEGAGPPLTVVITERPSGEDDPGDSWDDEQDDSARPED